MVSVPVLSKTIVSIVESFSMTLIFLMYIPLLPKIRITVPKVNGNDIANAQGHATIKTEVSTKIAVRKFPITSHPAKPNMAMAIMITVK